jgi:uncharacterized membrane protein
MAKKASIVFGIIFVIIGILGFFGNPIVGEGGLFHTDTVHNIVHLVLGIILLAFAKKSSAGTVLTVIGVIYLIVAIIGFISGTSVLGIFEVNAADNWLHLVLGIILGGLGLASRPKGAVPMSSGPAAL